MLLKGYKWDMRIYVLINKARPLTIHLYKEGIARFTSERYDTKSLKNIFSHLTNTSINKNAPNGQNIMSGSAHGQGIKWTFQQLKNLLRVIIIHIDSIGLRGELGEALGQNRDLNHTHCHQFGPLNSEP